MRTASLTWSPTDETAGLHGQQRRHAFGAGALLTSGVLFGALALLDFHVGPPPSSGAQVLVWRDSHAIALAWVSELLFFASVLLVPGTIALYQRLVDVDQTKASTSCAIVGGTIPIIWILLIVHGRLVYPTYGMRVDTAEIAAFVVAVFHGGLHAFYLLMSVATFVLSLALKRGGYPTWVVSLGLATAVSDIAGAYPWAIGSIGTLGCELVFGTWLVVVAVRVVRPVSPTPTRQ